MTCNPMPAALLAAMATLALNAAAQAPESGLMACRAEADDTRRLACYDREIDRTSQQPVSGEAVPAAPPAPSATPEERFGRTGEMSREENDRRAQAARDLTELNATVIEIWTRADGLMVFTLDNGQIWKQIRPDSLFRLKTGDKVKIQPAALGSFLLSGPFKRSTRVTRTQ